MTTTVYVIRVAGLAGLVVSRERPPEVPEGSWLKFYDPEAHAGRGAVVWTEDRSAAMTFASYEEAFNLWRTVPRSRPRRPDGKPNRPLTAFSVSIERAEVPAEADR